MFETVQKFNAVSTDIINQCIADYTSRQSYQTDTMNKTEPGKSMGILREICEEAVGQKLKSAGGNFYRHHLPYLPHTDYRTNSDNIVNAVIPLRYDGDAVPQLLIFDQMWLKDSVTWCMHHPLIHFEVNTGVLGYPCDYPVEGLTDQDINDELYDNYLSHLPKNGLRGLSGKNYPFTPGSIIIFDNRKIHCTSTLFAEKLGISLRFAL